MKKFAQTAILIGGLVGLSACANDVDVWKPYGTRTAGDMGQTTYSAPATEKMSMEASSGDMKTLRMCMERENRLLAMNKSCYRK